MDELDWHEIIKSWEASGQSQRAYCQSHGLNYNQFRNWRHKGVKSGLFQSAASNIGKRSVEAPSFSEVEVVQQADSTVVSFEGVIEVKLPHGIILRIPTC